LKIGALIGDRVASTRSDLVFDIGAHTGEDTAFYLGKGFRVIAVEASPTLARQLEDRFSAEVGAGRLVIVQRAIVRQTGDPISFFINVAHDDWSSIHRDVAVKGDMEVVEVTVETTSLADLCTDFGVPYYLKVDIEMGDEVVAESLVDLPVLPDYCSFEFHEDRMLDLLHTAGYGEFQIVNQLLNGFTERVTPAREGADFWPGGFTGFHSGYFGRDLPEDDWVDFVRAQEWRAANNITTRHGFMKHSWFDLHARASLVR
jgi:FkbM family methyltransferase